MIFNIVVSWLFDIIEEAAKRLKKRKKRKQKRKEEKARKEKERLKKQTADRIKEAKEGYKNIDPSKYEVNQKKDKGGYIK